jgi:uncharacterized membrane protein YhhN
MAPRFLIIVIAASCAALVGLLLAGYSELAIAAKLIASTGFVALAIQSGAPASAFGRLILAGLLLSWCGDMFLTGQSQAAFLGGLAAFLLAHVAYVAAFVKHGYHRAWTMGAAIPITIIAIIVWVWLEPHTPNNLSIPVRAYIVVISVMVIFAVGARGLGGSLFILAGAILFYLSDLSVASLRLVQVDYPIYIIGLPLYYAGQVCFALSVSQSRSH